MTFGQAYNHALQTDGAMTLWGRYYALMRGGDRVGGPYGLVEVMRIADGRLAIYSYAQTASSIPIEAALSEDWCILHPIDGIVYAPGFEPKVKNVASE